MKKSEWQEYLDGFYIVDCAIKNEKVAYVLIVQNEPPEPNEDGDIVDDEEWRVVSWGPEILGDGRSITSSSQFNFRPIPAMAVEGQPYNRLLVVDTEGNAILTGFGVDDAPVMEKLKTLWGRLHIMNGGYVYWRNSEEDNWEKIELPVSLLEANTIPGPRKYLLIDFDAFSPQDFYLLDWKGVIYYQTNGVWSDVNLRSLGHPNLYVQSICCGPDGWVYVFGKDEEGGKLFQGKGDKWKVIWTTGFEIHHTEFVSYQDHVLISNSALFSKIKNGVISTFDAPFYGSYLYAKDNLLIIANNSEAAIYDGHEWQVIISPNFDEDGNYRTPNYSFNQEEANY